MRRTLFILSLTLLLGSCTGVEKSTTMEQGNFAHVVYFWLKNPDNAEDRKAFETSLINFIESSEFIRTKHLGTPAATSRGVIDNSYTYCLLLTFDNKEMQDNYQVEEGHLKFIAESEDLWEKVIVYDSEDFLK